MEIFGIKISRKTFVSFHAFDDEKRGKEKSTAKDL